MNAQHRRWLITGAASGFGRALAEAVVAAGDAVVATARRPAALADLAEHPAVTVLTLDVTDGAQVRDVVARAVASGGVDVLVNCAGHGLIGAFEELTDAEFRGVMETNLFGALAVTKAVLPHMRERGSGHIVQLSSMGGVSANPGHAVYATSKFALEGASEALAGEVAPFGIRVTIVEPGPFRTDFLGRSITIAVNEMPEYAASSRRHYRETNNGNQAGDPDKAIAVILQAVDADDAPLHLPLGPAAHAIAERKLAAFRSDIDAWRDLTIATDFDQP